MGAVAHVRLNTGWLAAAEKRLLIRLAGRVPAYIGPDYLTALALVAMAAAGAAFLVARVWPSALLLVIVALAVNWIGDSLDGTLARVRKQERPRYGFYVDHVLDIAGISLLLGGMAFSGYMTPAIGLALLVAYLLTAGEVFLATAVNGQFRMSFLRIGPTELRIGLAIGVLALYATPVVSPFGLGPWFLFDIVGVNAAAGLLTAFLVSTAKTTASLYRIETVAGHNRRSQGLTPDA